MPTLGGTDPWAIDRVALSSTTDWVLYTVPGWATQIMIRNADSSASLYVGRYDETGTFASASDNYFTLKAGESLTLPLTPDNGRGKSDHWVVPLASSTASHAVEIVIVESPE